MVHVANAGTELKTETQGTNPETAEASIPSPQERANQFMAAVGKMVTLLARSPRHRLQFLADMDSVVFPAAFFGQFNIAERRPKAGEAQVPTPVGMIVWANVSDDVDQRLTQDVEHGLRLKPEEWKSGDIPWVIETVGPPKIIEGMLKRLTSTEWKGREPRIRSKAKDGSIAVGHLKLATNPSDKPTTTSGLSN